MEVRFSQNLKALRAGANLTQGALAQGLGTTQRKVSYWESGKVEPDIADLWKIADFFDVTVDELIGRRA